MHTQAEWRNPLFSTEINWKKKPVFNHLQATFRLNKQHGSVHRDSLHLPCVLVEIWPPYTTNKDPLNISDDPGKRWWSDRSASSTHRTLPRHRNRVCFVTLHQFLWFRRPNHLFIETWPRGGRQERKSADELWKEAGIKANGEGEISHLSLCPWIANLPLFKTLP